MGKFISTEYKDSIQSIQGMTQDLLHNQYYRYNDKKGIVITNYYNINKEATSLDPGSGLAYSEIGKDSPIWYNYIEGFIMYSSSPRIELDIDNGDYGLEANKITGEYTILPNSCVVPCEGDHFEIPEISSGKYLFKVTKVSKDTLENGDNAFKIECVMDQITNEDIKCRIADRFICVDVQDGTNRSVILENTKYKFIKMVDNVCGNLRRYYIDLFFNRYVQAFVVPYHTIMMGYIYDPYLIEFMKRNDVLSSNSTEYVSVSHQLGLSPTFSLDYNRSIFMGIEKREKVNLKSYINTWRLEVIRNIGSIFNTRYEPYFEAKQYTHEYTPSECNTTPIGVGTILPASYIDDICHNTKRYDDASSVIHNIIVKYFNDESIIEGDLKDIDYIDNVDSIELFYMMPILIYCLESYVKSLLA